MVEKKQNMNKGASRGRNSEKTTHSRSKRTDRDVNFQNDHNLQQPHQPDGVDELINFKGRPAHDRSDSSDADRQHQRESQPYGERYFWPDEEGYNDFYRIHTKAIHAVGNVGDDEVPFFSAWFDETLADGTRRRCVRIMSEDGVTELFKVCTWVDANGNVQNSVTACGVDLCALEARLTAAGI